MGFTSNLLTVLIFSTQHLSRLTNSYEGSFLVSPVTSVAVLTMNAALAALLIPISIKLLRGRKPSRRLYLPTFILAALNILPSSLILGGLVVKIPFVEELYYELYYLCKGSAQFLLYGLLMLFLATKTLKAELSKTV